MSDVRLKTPVQQTSAAEKSGLPLRARDSRALRAEEARTEDFGTTLEHHVRARAKDEKPAEPTRKRTRDRQSDAHGFVAENEVGFKLERRAAKPSADAARNATSGPRSIHARSEPHPSAERRKADSSADPVEGAGAELPFARERGVAREGMDETAGATSEPALAKSEAADASDGTTPATSRETEAEGKIAGELPHSGSPLEGLQASEPSLTSDAIPEGATKPGLSVTLDGATLEGATKVAGDKARRIEGIDEGAPTGGEANTDAIAALDPGSDVEDSLDAQDEGETGSTALPFASPSSAEGSPSVQGSGLELSGAAPSTPHALTSRPVDAAPSLTARPEPNAAEEVIRTLMDRATYTDRIDAEIKAGRAEISVGEGRERISMIVETEAKNVRLKMELPSASLATAASASSRELSSALKTHGLELTAFTANTREDGHSSTNRERQETRSEEERPEERSSKQETRLSVVRAIA